MIEQVVSKLDAEDSKKVLDFLEEHSGDQPFPESESYYSRSSHSHHDSMLGWMWYELKNVFAKASADEKSADVEVCRAVATDLEKYFTVAYAASAVYDEINGTYGVTTGHYPSGHPKWFHGPFLGGWITFHDKWNDDFRVPLGKICRSTDLKSDPLVVKAYTGYERLLDIRRQCVKRDGKKEVWDTEKEVELRSELPKLHAVLREVLDLFADRIGEHCSGIQPDRKGRD